MTAGDLLFRMVLFALLGLGMEVVFTALVDVYEGTASRHLMGYSSVWYVFLYILAPIFFRFAGPEIFRWPWLARGFLYMLVFYAGEFCGMWVLRVLLGTSPSEESYRRARWGVWGLIRLDFAPAWFGAGLLMELFYRRLG